MYNDLLRCSVKSTDSHEETQLFLRDFVSSRSQLRWTKSQSIGYTRKEKASNRTRYSILAIDIMKDFLVPRSWTILIFTAFNFRITSGQFFGGAGGGAGNLKRIIIQISGVEKRMGY